MKRRTGRKGCLKRVVITLSAFMLALSIPMEVLADGDFSGDITITETVEGYEYKAYEVLDCIAAGGEDSVFMATESWKEFLKTNENAIAMLIPQENNGDYPTAEEGSDLYTVDMESDKAVRQAFAADVLEYAEENGIEAYESITAEGGERKVTFQYLPLGIYVIDTAGRARITVMWDMDWQSEIKESYQLETATAETRTETEEKTEIQQDATNSTEENSVDENMEADIPLETEGEDNATEEPLAVKEDAQKADSKAPVMIVAVVVVLALAAVLVFVKKKK